MTGRGESSIAIGIRTCNLGDARQDSGDIVGAKFPAGCEAEDSGRPNVFAVEQPPLDAAA